MLQFDFFINAGFTADKRMYKKETLRNGQNTLWQISEQGLQPTKYG